MCMCMQHVGCCSMQEFVVVSYFLELPLQSISLHHRTALYSSLSTAWREYPMFLCPFLAREQEERSLLRKYMLTCLLWGLIFMSSFAVRSHSQHG